MLIMTAINCISVANDLLITPYLTNDHMESFMLPLRGVQLLGLCLENITVEALGQLRTAFKNRTDENTTYHLCRSTINHQFSIQHTLFVHLCSHFTIKSNLF